MKVLVACEESQRVCMAFREKEHEAYSCDIIDCSGGHPEWHVKQDVIPLLSGNCSFVDCVERLSYEIGDKIYALLLYGIHQRISHPVRIGKGFEAF